MAQVRRGARMPRCASRIPARMGGFDIMKAPRTSRPFAGACLLLLSGLPPAVQAADITLTDQRDKLITLREPAQRVIVFPKPIASMFIAVDGGTRHLAGIHPGAQSVIMTSILGTFFPEVSTINTNIAREGFVPNVEEVLKAGPDVVVQWALKVADYIEPMERVGLTVVGLGYGTNEIERERIAILGKILGQGERAGSFLAWQDDVRRDIEAHLSTMPATQRSRMIFFDRFRSDGMTAFRRDEFFFQAAGVTNVTVEAGMSQPNVTVDPEQVLAWDPDIVFLNYYDESAKPDDLYADPVLGSLSAVKARRVYKTPRLDPASHEAPLVWMWMTMLAYPELYDWDLRAKVREKYNEIYGKTVSDDDIDNIIQMAVNGDSKHYHEMFDK
jgi:iron complex transport system substrate-binding protein